MKRKLMGLLCAMLCILMLAQPAFAAEAAPEVSIPVKINVKGNKPAVPEKYTVKMYADDASYPMPEGSEGGVCVMTVRGADTVNFPAITYNRVGIYTYTIYQVKGKAPNCTYDETIYTLTVYITNAEGGGLQANVALYADGEGSKMDKAEFTNRYKYEPSDTPQTNDESNFPLYAVLAGGSVLVLLLLFLTRKREENY